MLSLERLDYRQLRRIFKLVAESRGEVPSRKWARFTFQDLAAIRAAVHALGGPDAIAQSKRLPIKRLERACAALRADYGLTSPLTQARLVWDGRDVIVQLRGARFEPDTGQLLLRLAETVNNHLDYAGASAVDRRALRPQVSAQSKQIRHDGRRHTTIVDTLAVGACLRFGKGK